MGSVSWVRGTHNIKIGAGVIRRQVSELQSSHPRGNAYINGSDPALPGSGNDLAVLLNGLTTQVSRGYTVDSPNFLSWEASFYFQDDWRATPNLTLNLGVRYDLYTPFTAPNEAFTISTLISDCFTVRVCPESSTRMRRGESRPTIQTWLRSSGLRTPHARC